MVLAEFVRGRYVNGGPCMEYNRVVEEEVKEVKIMRKRKGIYQYAMWIPFCSAMQREGILSHLKAAVEILIEGPQERIEEIIEKRQDTVAGFVRQIWEAIKDNPA